MRYLKTFESFEGGNSVSAESLVSNPGFKKACDDMKSFIESEVIPNLTPEELEKFRANAMEVANKLGVSKGSDASEVTASMLQKIEDKSGAPDLKTAVMSLSGEANESISDWFSKSPKVKRFAAQLGSFLGVGAVVAGIIMMVANASGSYFGGWSSSEFLTSVHDYTSSVFGEAAGPIGMLMTLGGGIAAFMSGVKASEIGDEIRRDARRGAKEAF